MNTDLFISASYRGVIFIIVMVTIILLKLLYESSEIKMSQKRKRKEPNFKQKQPSNLYLSDVAKNHQKKKK